jgi:hypothetical protein
MIWGARWVGYKTFLDFIDGQMPRDLRYGSHEVIRGPRTTIGQVTTLQPHAAF